MAKSYIWQQKEWPCLTWDDSALLNYLSQARKIQGKMLAQAADIGLEAQAQILIEDAQMTAAIEGETLNPFSIRSSVAKRLGLSTAGLPAEQRAIEGLVEMLMEATENHKKPLTAKRLKSWQAGLFPTGFSSLHKIVVGNWLNSKEPMRVISERIGNEKIHYEAPPSAQITNQMQKFLDWFNSSKKVDGLVRAAVAHF